MNTTEFKKVVECAVLDLISDEHFANVASRNLMDSQGNEEELYPFFTEMVRRRLRCNVLGIGWGKYPNKNQKADCLCYLTIDNRKATFSVELKGPSKDSAWVSKGLKEDLEKLNRLKGEGVIDYGLAIGIWLKDKEKNSEKFAKVLTINSSRIGIKVSIRDTQ